MDDMEDYMNVCMFVYKHMLLTEGVSE